MPHSVPGQIDAPRLRTSAEATAVRVITPGSSAGEPLHVLSSLERPTARSTDPPAPAHRPLVAPLERVSVVLSTRLWRSCDVRHRFQETLERAHEVE